MFMERLLDTGDLLKNKNSVGDIIETISIHKLWNYTRADVLENICKRYIGDHDSELMKQIKNYQQEPTKIMRTGIWTIFIM